MSPSTVHLHLGRTLLLRKKKLLQVFNSGRAHRQDRLASLKHHIMLSSSSKDSDTLITVQWSEKGFCLYNPSKITLCEVWKKKKTFHLYFGVRPIFIQV